MDNEENKYGFSGLSELVSNVEGLDNKVESSVPNIKKTSPQKKPQKKTKMPPSNESKKRVSDTIPTEESASSNGNLGNTGGKWIIGIIAVLVIIWLVNAGEKAPIRPSTESIIPQTPTSDQLKPFSETKQTKEVENVGFPLDFNGACQLQEILRYLCLYNGKIDGIIGPRSKKAIDDLIEKEGLQIKNNINTNLLDFLRNNYLSKPSPCSYSNEPKNGHVFLSSGENTAPLQIRIPNYGKNFFVKIVNPNTNKSVKEFYVKSGQTVETNVPLGTFHLKYAAGKIWVGKFNLFGVDTVYSKANKEFSFYQIGDQVNGYTVELILQAGGNLKTSKIDSENF